MDAIVTVHDKQFKMLLSAQQIQQRLDEICAQINIDYKDKKPIFVGILNGAFMFAADVIRRFEGDCEVTFIKLNSYVGEQSSGLVKTAIGLERDIEGRHVILLEDIVDSGTTMYHFLPLLQILEPASVAVFSCILKPSALQHPIHLDYVAFEVENLFLIGYGLDYNQLGRHYTSIYQVC